MHGETDSQLVNSTYVDNAAMELYHGRLDKSPGAIALRMRWYGTGTPEIVFVERKTHREAWTGDVSVKERFIINASQVNDLMAGTFDKVCLHQVMYSNSIISLTSVLLSGGRDQPYAW
jgi:SPX domain protein involved in polyphosphate accumulation